LVGWGHGTNELLVDVDDLFWIVLVVTNGVSELAMVSGKSRDIPNSTYVVVEAQRNNGLRHLREEASKDGGDVMWCVGFLSPVYLLPISARERIS
jgi:hypothetical protein